MPVIVPHDMLHGAPLPGWDGHFFHSANMTFAHWTIDADAAPLHEHQHLQEEVWNVIEGELLLSIAGVEQNVPAGCAAIVPPDTPHSARVTGACRAIVTDFPRRHDLPGVNK